MKKFLTLLKAWTGWTLSWVCFWPGHWTSVVMHYADWTSPVLYHFYGWFMLGSSMVQDWGGGFGAWEDVSDVDLEEECATCGNGPGSHSTDCPLAKE